MRIVGSFLEEHQRAHPAVGGGGQVAGCRLMLSLQPASAPSSERSHLWVPVGQLGTYRGVRKGEAAESNEVKEVNVDELP